MDAANQLIQGLAGARITVQNEQVLTIRHTQTADSLGEAMFSDLPVGRYKFRATAADHQEKNGFFWIKPAITTALDVFLDYNLVTVEWQVTETTIEDTYEIVLTAKYLTDVPAAVVVVHPTSVTLPQMKTGDVFNGEFTLTNHGLIRADNVRFNLPKNNQYFRFEVLNALPEMIEAKQSVILPFRVTCLMSPDQPGSGSGGGCHAQAYCSGVYYQYICGNGNLTSENQRYCISKPDTCPDANEGSGSGGYPGADPSDQSDSIGEAGPGQAGISKPAPAPTQIKSKGFKCPPLMQRKPQDIYDYVDIIPDSPGIEEFTHHADLLPFDHVKLEETKQCVGSSVNTVLAEYQRDDTDMAVKVPGGKLRIHRRFIDGKWRLGPSRINMQQVDRPALLKYKIGDQTVQVIIDEVAYKILKAIALKITYDDSGNRYYNVVTEIWEYRYLLYGNYHYSPHQLTSKNGEWRTFDDNGRLESFGNRNGTLATILYDLNDKPIAIADRNGKEVVWYEYNANGRISAIKDTDGRRVAYEYNDKGQLRLVRNTMGHETRFEYTKLAKQPHLTTQLNQSADILSQYGPGGYTIGSTGTAYTPPQELYSISKITYPNGRVANISYNDAGEVTSVLDAGGRGHEFSYDYDKHEKQYYARTAFPNGSIKEVWYNEQGVAIRVDLNGSTIETIAYGDRHRKVTDAFGNTTQEFYDEWGNLIRRINPDGTQIKNTYSTEDYLLKSTIDEKGIATRFNHDAKGNLTQMIEASGTDEEIVTEFTYDNDGNRLTQKRIGREGTMDAQRVMTYDEDGNMISLTDAEGGQTHYTYDGRGNQLNRLDPRGHLWKNEYDALDRVITSTDPLSNQTHYHYDAMGNLTRIIDPQAHETTYGYDLNNNLIKATDAEGGQIRIEYNQADMPIRITDPEGHRFIREYDIENKMVRAADSTGNEMTIEYPDVSGDSCTGCSGGKPNQPQRIVFPTFEKSFTYDSFGRQIEESDRFGSDGQRVFGSVYDAKGNLIRKTDAQGNHTTYEYDCLDRLIQVTDAHEGKTVYEYDTRGNLTALTDVNGNTTGFAYDRNDRLVKQIRPLQQQTHYQYDGNGNMTDEFDAKGQRIAYLYDDADRLTQIRYFNSSDHQTPVKTVSFSYDKSGNLTGVEAHKQ